MILATSLRIFNFLPKTSLVSFHRTLFANPNFLNKNISPQCSLNFFSNQNVPATSFLYNQKRLFAKTNTDLKNSSEKTASISVVEEENEDAEDDILYKRIQIEARSADRAVLDSYEKFVSISANHLGITMARVWEPFRTIKRRTLLRSAFVKKKYRVQYEFRTYYRCMEFKYLTGSTAETFLEYIERNLPEGTALKVTRQRIEELPSHLVPPNEASSSS